MDNRISDGFLMPLVAHSPLADVANKSRRRWPLRCDQGCLSQAGAQSHLLGLAGQDQPFQALAFTPSGAGHCAMLAP